MAHLARFDHGAVIWCLKALNTLGKFTAELKPKLEQWADALQDIMTENRRHHLYECRMAQFEPRLPERASRPRIAVMC